MGRKILYVTGIFLIVGFSIFYINQRYFFNPVVFSQDVITPYDWNDYERPLTMTYYNLDEERQVTVIKEEEEIREFLTALKESPRTNKVEMPQDVNGALKLSGPKQTLLEVYFYTNHWQVLKNNGPIYEMTQSLEQIVKQY
ncbi:hypothetical protein LCL89_08650 [Halobacillus yeomjeoni]|uniref:hypothetical protein n=1 Tax=Halobacillus yeomjeoni TaxID=311194 RepID=UPI001CD62E3D|nr:hypothetical protein [Halobacillus yeomjeoni]MCA0984110.1 hypothetical protein [Halobacillus yeomjeoni]